MEDGYKGGLIGNELTEDSHVFDDENSLIRPNDGTDRGGDVNVAEGGEFQFGSDGTGEKHTGWVEDLNNEGSTTVTNGDYGVKGDVTGNGDLDITGSGSLTAGGIIMPDAEEGEGGTISNDGRLEVTKDGTHGSGETYIGEGNKLVNNGTFEAEGTETTVKGEIITAGPNGESHYGDLNIEVGSNIVTAGGTETGANLNVSAGGSTSIEENGRSEFENVTITGTEDKPSSVVVAGEADWNNIRVGSSTDFTNTEKGLIDTDHLDVDGSFINAGTIAGKTDGAYVSVGSGGRLENIETGIIRDFDVSVDQGGTMINAGTVTTKTGTSVVEGTYTTASRGESSFDRLVVENGGLSVVEAGGAESGNTLEIGPGGSLIVAEDAHSSWTNVTLEGTSDHPAFAQNSGTSHWENLKIGESDSVINDETGTLRTGSAVINGSFENSGLVSGTGDDASFTVGEKGSAQNNETGVFENIDIKVEGGEFTTAGTISGGNITVAGDGSFTVTDGTVTGGILDASDGTFEVAGGSAQFESDSGRTLIVGADGSFTVEVDSTSSWQEAVISGRADILGSADWLVTDIREGADVTAKNTLAGETLRQSGGVLTAESGSVVFSNLEQTGGIFTVGDSVTAHFAESAKVGGSTVVSGKFVVGTDTDFDERIGAGHLNSKPMAIVGKTVEVASGGSLTIGSSATPQLTDGLVFGSDSVTILDVQSLNGKTAFKGSGTGTVSVENGATLILGNVTEAGTYKIAEGFLTTGESRAAGSLINGWLDEDHLLALNEDGSGLNWVLDLDWNASSVWVNASLADVRTEYDGLTLTNNANALLKSCGSGSPDSLFVCGILRSHDLDKAEKTRILNSVAQIGVAGGITASAYENMVSAVDALESRVSFAGETFTHDGRSVESPNGSNLWVTMLGRKHKSDNLKSADGSAYGYETDVYGLMVGFDKAVTQQVRVGTAFSYQDGSLDSLGSFLNSSNDYTTYGLSVYLSGAVSEHLNLIGSLGWYWNEADVSMGIGAEGFGSAKASADSTMFSAALRAEGRFDMGNISVIPHAGIRMLVTNTGDYSTMIDGRETFRTHEDSRLTVQLPIGITLRGDVKTASGWNVAPTADITVTPQFGDTHLSARTRGVSSGAEDAFSAKFAGRFTSSLNLGVKAQKDSLTFGANIGTTMGTGGKSDTTLGLTAKFAF